MKKCGNIILVMLFKFFLANWITFDLFLKTIKK